MRTHCQYSIKTAPAANDDCRKRHARRYSHRCMLTISRIAFGNNRTLESDIRAQLERKLLFQRTGKSQEFAFRKLG